MAFSSTARSVPLTEVEEALLAWAACGPNGTATWDRSAVPGEKQAVDRTGYTVPHPDTVPSASLLIINDEGSWVYRPTVLERGQADQQHAREEREAHAEQLAHEALTAFNDGAYDRATQLIDKAELTGRTPTRAQPLRRLGSRRDPSGFASLSAEPESAANGPSLRTWCRINPHS